MNHCAPMFLECVIQDGDPIFINYLGINEIVPNHSQLVSSGYLNWIITALQHYINHCRFKFL